MHTQTLQVTLRCLLQGLEEMGRRGGRARGLGAVAEAGASVGAGFGWTPGATAPESGDGSAHLARRLSTAGHETEGAAERWIP